MRTVQLQYKTSREVLPHKAKAPCGAPKERLFPARSLGGTAVTMGRIQVCGGRSEAGGNEEEKGESIQGGKEGIWGKWFMVWFGWNWFLRKSSMIFKRLLGFEHMKATENGMRTG